MRKHFPLLLLIISLLYPCCDILNSPGKPDQTGGSCEVEIVSHNYSYEIRADGERWVYYKIKIWNRGTISCKCTVTILSYGENDSLLEKKEAYLGIVTPGETKEYVVYTDVLYKNMRRYSIELKCDPAVSGEERGY